jgi:penicillin-binding protein 1C
VAIEDDRFYQHIGIEPKAILRAVLVNLGLREGYQGQGGSTITQQVIKNALLTQEKTITRKVKEWVLAIKLERVLTKDEILELYLNEAPYGGNIYGIQEASMAFFGKSSDDITLAEAAYLAALPQAPTRYSPYGSNVDQLVSRKDLVLRKMRDLGSITVEEYSSAVSEKVTFIPQAEKGIKAPHFVMFVKERLVEMYGEEAVNEGGLKVLTTIDMDLQTKAEEMVIKHAETNEKQFNASNAALVAVDPKTGGIRVMVGSRDYFDMEHEGNFNIAVAKRQPGSAFKPFVYGAAFELGYTPDTVLFDVQTQFSTRCDPFGKPLGTAEEKDCYMPVNYDGVYRGPISLRNALAQSINVPAVKLLYLVGLDHALEFAERIGITTLVDKARYGLTLVLGGGEVTLLDLTSAYGVFANDGKRLPYTGIERIEDSQGNLLYESIPTEREVIGADVARRITSILSDNEARTPAFGARSYLYFPDRSVAVKTGTTNDYRDAWIIGYTPSLVVGAWAGNNDNTPMEKKVAGFIIAPLWNEFFTEAFEIIPDEQFPPPQPIPQTIKPALRGVWYGGDTYKIDKISGKLATEFTPPEMIMERAIPNPHEILYWVDRRDPLGPAPENPYIDPQFSLWELPSQVWLVQNGLPKEALQSIPTGYDDIHKPEFAPNILIDAPNSSTTYRVDEKLIVSPRISSVFPVEHVDYFVNGVFLGSTKSIPYEFAFVPIEVGNIRVINSLKVVVHDIAGNIKETELQFMVDTSSMIDRLGR